MFVSVFKIFGYYFCGILLLLFWAFPCQAQDIKKDLIPLRNELNRLGLDIEKSSWSITDKNEELTIYESQKRKAFFIVVNEEYRKYVNNTIVAYSETDGFQGTESPWKKNLIHAYSEQLRKSKERARIAEQH